MVPLHMDPQHNELSDVNEVSFFGWASLIFLVASAPSLLHPFPASLRGWLDFVPFFYLLSIVTKEDSSASAEHEESVC